jgi:siroheme synthase-like protein
MITAVIIGGGNVAARKASTFLDSGASVRIIGAAIGESVKSLASSGAVRLEVIERPYSGVTDLGDADIVIAATDDAAINARIANDARSIHRFVSVVTSQGEGNFSSMAVHRAGALVVGVGTGNLPGAAARIRDAIAGRFDERYAAAIARCAAIRADSLERNASDWQRTHRDLVGPDFCDRVESGALEESLR